MAMKQLPAYSRSCANPEPRDSGEDSGRSDDPEEMPEAAREPSCVELPRQQAPGERRRSDESDEEAEVRSDVLDRGAAEVIELGNDGGYLTGMPGSNVALRRHFACSLCVWLSTRGSNDES